MQNIQEIWDTVKRPNLRVVVIKEELPQLKDSENIFNKLIVENLPNLKNGMPTKVQGSYRTSNQLDQKRKTPQYIVIKTLNTQKKKVY